MDVLDLVNDHNHVGPGHDIMVRPYVCKYGDCDKAFARKSDLARHFRIHTGDRPFVCLVELCGKSFIQRSALTVHTRVHTGERPHLCEKCEKAFADSSSLARHRRIHTGKRPYQCKMTGCGRAFARRNTFLKHFKRTHPDHPPPSNASRTSHYTNILVPRPSNVSGTYLAPGPPGPDGQPQYFVSTSNGNGAPHGYAASHPSGGAAYLGGGFGGSGSFPGSILGGHGGVGVRGKGLHSVSGRSGDGGGGGYGQSGGGNGPGGHFCIPGAGAFRSSQSLTPMPTPISISDDHQGYATSTHTPVSACTSSRGDGSDLQSPSTPFLGESDIGGQEQGRQSSQTGTHLAFGHAQGNGPFSASAQYASQRVPQGMIYYRSDGGIRSVSEPMQRGQLYAGNTPWGGVGGGFAPGQLLIPPSEHPGFRPTFYQSDHPMSRYPPHVPASTTDEGSENGSREMSPEPLVDIHSVPSFSFHPPNGPPTSVPYSAVAGQQFNPLTHGPPQMAMATPIQGRLHSAPPYFQRFHSTPNMQSEASWGQMPPYAGPGGYGDAHSIGGGRSGESEEWEDLEDLEDEMLSREVSAGAEETMMEMSTESTLSSTESQKPLEKLQGHWDAPIQFPSNPAAMSQSRNPFSSSASSASTSSTLVAPPCIHPTTLPPIAICPQATHPMALTPINHGFYPTPITPWSHGPEAPSLYDQEPSKLPYHPHFPHSILASPASIRPNHYPGHPTYSPEIPLHHSDVHDITLTTPPKDQQRPDGVATVGLGIANVHFDNRESAIKRDPNEEGESEVESDEEMDAGQEDDSDDEFLPPGKKRGKPLKGKKGKGKKGSRVASTHPVRHR